MTERIRREKLTYLRDGLAALLLVVAVSQAGCSGGSRNGSSPGGSPSGGTDPSDAAKLEGVKETLARTQCWSSVSEPANACLEGVKETLARTQAKRIETALQVYFVRNNVYPPTLAELTQKDAAGGGPFLPADALRDPWGKEYQFDPSGTHNKGEKPDVWTTTPGGKVIGNFKK
jgi:hypothetical protein